ncbi:MAG: endonuclease/exonuclease/phosphatase family protein [Muribaculaceae bacterium]|nr:endonuclease/exonuclease/phosphatase family protein [Muribaculaceae bacterium]
MEAAAEVKLMGFNVRYIAPTDTGNTSWEVRKYAIKKMMDEVQPDVVAVGEARGKIRPDLVELLQDYDTVVIKGTGNRHGANTIIIYNKKKVELKKQVYFFHSATPDEPSMCWDVSTKKWRGSCWGLFKEKATGKKFYFFATHLCLGLKNCDLEAKLNSAMLNVDKMQEIAGEKAPVFITGDINASYEADDVRRWGLQPFYYWMTDARTAPITNNEPTFNAFGGMKITPKHVIDHMFYRNANVKKFENLNEPKWGVPYISDHYPIMITADLY